MYNIDTASAVGSMPVPASAGTAGWFDQNSPWTSTSADWANGIQAELLNILAAASITPNKATTNQIVAAIQALIVSGSSTQISSDVPALIAASNPLTKLSASLDLYVSTTGNDSHNGSIGSPFLTLQKAWDYLVANYNVNGHAVTIHVADGTYTAGVYTQGMPVGNNGGITFLGNASTPANVLINVTNGSCFGSNGSYFVINGFKLQASGTVGNDGICIVGGIAADIEFKNINFGASRGHVLAGLGSAIYCTNNYTISAGGDTHLLAQFTGTILINNCTVTLIGTPNFNIYAAAFLCGVIEAVGVTFSGPAFGAKYNVSANGVITTAGGGASYFPGNTSGSSGTGGQYQ